MWWYTDDKRVIFHCKCQSNVTINAQGGGGMHTHPTLHIYKPISILYMQELIEHDTRGHIIYHSLSHCWESIWITRRSTCQTLLCWHMDCSPNTYIHLKGGRGRDKETESTLTALQGTCMFFLTTFLGAWIDNHQRGVGAVMLHQSLPPPWEIAALRSEEFWDVPFEEHKAQLELFEQMFLFKSPSLRLITVFQVVFLLLGWFLQKLWAVNCVKASATPLTSGGSPPELSVPCFTE